jgi:hypothetical protein
MFKIEIKSFKKSKYFWFMLAYSNLMEQRALKNLSSSWNTKFSFYLETSGVLNYYPYLNVVQFFDTRVN